MDLRIRNYIWNIVPHKQIYTDSLLFIQNIIQNVFPHMELYPELHTEYMSGYGNVYGHTELYTECLSAYRVAYGMYSRIHACMRNTFLDAVLAGIYVSVCCILN